MELMHEHGVTDKRGIKTAEERRTLQREYKVEENGCFGKVFFLLLFRL
jgi:hypothetical protein